MGGVSGDHVGPGSGCRAPGCRRLPPPARRSLRPSVRPRRLPARGAMGSPRPRRPHGPPAPGATCARPETPALLPLRRQGAARGGGGTESLPF